MRPIVSDLGYIPRGRSGRNVIVLIGYVVFLAVVIAVHARVFQYLMATYESDPDHSFINGLYWTITTMTTLGYGDITFLSHAGKLFSAWVTLSGFIFLLILLPFGIISVVFAPWLENLLRYRPRTRLKRGLKEHVVICGWDPVTETLARSLVASDTAYVTIEPDVEEVRRLEEAGASALLGVPTDAQTLTRARVETARLVIANMSDPDNVNLALTVASLCSTPVAAVVTQPERKELMTVAGARHVVPLRETLGNYLAVRATTRGAMGHVVDSLGDLLFAEIPTHGTPLVGLSIRSTNIREKTGISVIGLWERGRFSLPEPEKTITDGMIMLLVGTEAGLTSLEEMIGQHTESDFVIVLGHGTVGSSAAAFLRRRGVRHTIVDRDAVPDDDEPELIQGDASEHEVLMRAGIERARGLIVTTNDDGTNVFLTLASRHLNPHVRIAARANREENVDELYAAGADFVVSHSSVGASILTNIVAGRQNVFLSEGVHIFWKRVPQILHGKTLTEARLRSLTGATVVAIRQSHAKIVLDLSPETVLDQSTSLLLVGTAESETLFSKRFGGKRKANDSRRRMRN
ncbi:MAG: potassium transporter TrkA [Actinobacteria bacterium]|nr:potassium transporter TrkA [Actinomycetota bacterium]